jgi:hypothetical protein
MSQQARPKSSWEIRAEVAEAETARLRAALADVLCLAKEATNGWACYAKRKIEHDEIARLHREIAALGPSTPYPADEGRLDPNGLG